MKNTELMRLVIGLEKLDRIEGYLYGITHAPGSDWFAVRNAVATIQAANMLVRALIGNQIGARLNEVR